jgi:hypothetical protein
MTAVEWLIKQICEKHTDAWKEEIKQALEMEKQQSQDYAKFAIVCDRKEIPILNFVDYIKL